MAYLGYKNKAFREYKREQERIRMLAFQKEKKKQRRLHKNLFRATVACIGENVGVALSGPTPGTDAFGVTPTCGVTFKKSNVDDTLDIASAPVANPDSSPVSTMPPPSLLSTVASGFSGTGTGSLFSSNAAFITS